MFMAASGRDTVAFCRTQSFAPGKKKERKNIEHEYTSVLTAGRQGSCMQPQTILPFANCYPPTAQQFNSVHRDR